jgi:hypothetical protein
VRFSEEIQKCAERWADQHEKQRPITLAIEFVTCPKRVSCILVALPVPVAKSAKMALSLLTVALPFRYCRWLERSEG